MRRFEGKVAVVVGATSGIGRATAVAFAREGARVVIAGRRQKEGGETLGLVQQAGGEGIYVQTDVTIEAQVEALVNETMATYGRLDYAFNNAGFEQMNALVDQTDASYASTMDTNVRGIFWGMKYEIPAMLKTGGGAIVNSSSITGLVGVPQNSLYSASKHAVLGLTKTTALEVARSNIRVNAICASAVAGAMLQGFLDYNHLTSEELGAMIPMGRICQPEEIAPVVLFLCSEDASYITGAWISIDGGSAAQ